MRSPGIHPTSVAVLLTLSFAACSRSPLAGAGRAADARRVIEWEEVLRLRNARHYFTLRDRLEHTTAAGSPAARFGRALVQQAFNAPAASNATIAALLSDTRLPDSLVAQLRRAQLANHLRLFEYAAGLAVTQALVADTTHLDSATLRDVRNTERIFRALADVPPQTATVRGVTELRFERGRVPLSVNDSLRHYVFDTGANLSTIMRSEAEAVGLRILAAGIDVGTSTDQRVVADLGVADRLSIGQVHYRHVVFLVLDDRLLTFPDGFRIPGIIGFPVIERMGEVQVGRSGELVVPRTPPVRLQRNLALEELTPLTQVRWAGAPAGDAPMLCRLDTGASRSQLYAPFYRRYQAQIDAVAARSTSRYGGAGGVRETPVRVLPQVRLALGDTAAVLDSVDVMLQSIARGPSEDYLDCNIGHDVLDAFSRYILNFRDMAFLLR